MSGKHPLAEAKSLPAGKKAHYKNDTLQSNINSIAATPEAGDGDDYQVNTEFFNGGLAIRDPDPTGGLNWVIPAPHIFACTEARIFSVWRQPRSHWGWTRLPCWTSKPLLAEEQKAEIGRYRHYGRRAKPPQSPKAWSHIAPPPTPSSFFSAHDTNALERGQAAEQATFLKKLAHKISYGGGDKIPADFWVRPRAVAPAKQADAAALFRHRPISQTVLATAAETPLRDVNQCAAALQVSPRAVRQMISSGELKRTRRLVRHQDLLACIEAREKARPAPPRPDFSAVEQHADPELDNPSDAHSAFDEMVSARIGHIPALGDDATNNRAKASPVLFDLAETAGYSAHKVGAYSREPALSDEPAEGVSLHVARRAAKRLKADGYSDVAAWLRANNQRIRKPRPPESRGDIEAHVDAAREALKNPAAFEVWLADFQSKARHVQQREAYEAGRYRKALAALKADPTVKSLPSATPFRVQYRPLGA